MAIFFFQSNEIPIEYNINLENHYGNIDKFYNLSKMFMETCKLQFSNCNEYAEKVKETNYTFEKDNFYLETMMKRISKRASMTIRLIPNEPTYNILLAFSRIIKDREMRNVITGLENKINNILTQHFENMEHFRNILQNPKENLFQVIDIIKLDKMISEKREKMKTMEIIPQLNLFDLMEFSQIDSSINRTHINILIHIPVVLNTVASLHTFIPRPQHHNNGTIILDEKHTYYYFDLFKYEFLVISKQDLKECMNYEYTTICNSLVAEHSIKPNDCILSRIINKGNATSCKYRKIEHKNYILKLSRHLTLFYIVNPIIIRTVCKNNVITQNMTSDSHISLDKNCNVFKSKDYDESDNYININMDIKGIEINFTYFNEKIQSWNEMPNLLDEAFSITNVAGFSFFDGIYDFFKKPYDDIVSAIQTIITCIKVAFFIIISCIIIKILSLIFSTIKCIYTKCNCKK